MSNTPPRLHDPLAPEPVPEEPAPFPDPLPKVSSVPEPPPQTSFLAILSVLSLVLGPPGAILAMVAGLSARREIRRSGGRRRGMGLATAAVALGALAATGWAAYIGVTYGDAWVARIARLRHPDPPGTSHVGDVTVVDLAPPAGELKTALATELATAAKDGETLLVMTTARDCDPCRGVDTSLSDPLLQKALGHVRLVRLDVAPFAQDLTALHVPIDRIPGFFLMDADGLPRDGIDGGEWDEDVPVNIAPVLGAFVHGKYTKRRDRWKPPPGSGVVL